MPSLSETNQTGKQYWRSLNELAETDEFKQFMHREFPAGAIDQLSGPDRRHFLKIMGASMALAGMGVAGCRRWPKEEILPYAKRPEDFIPGAATHYATCREQGGVASSLLVTAIDQRPIKIEGNPDSSQNRGATTMHDQASILDLYDPDRSRQVLHRTGGEIGNASWSDFAAWAASQRSTIRNRGGGGLAILSEATSSPSVQWLRNRLDADFDGLQWFEYEPVGDASVVAGLQMAFGSPMRPVYDLSKAKCIVSLDAELLTGSPATIAQARGFADSRRTVDDSGHPMSRMYCYEPGLSLTGSNADDRVAVRPSDIAVIASRLAVAVGVTAGSLGSAADADAALSDEVKANLTHAISDLNSNRGTSLVVAGEGQPAEVHAIVAAINAALGNAGQTVKYVSAGQPADGGIVELAAALNNDSIDTLLILGGNPVYNAPVDLDIASALSRASEVVHLSDYVDETSQHDAVTWHVNRAHYLEAWGDGRAADGTVLLAQPLIEPLFAGRSAIEVLAAFLDDDVTAGRDIVQRTFRDMRGSGGFDRQWPQALHDGAVAGTGDGGVSGTVNNAAVASAGNALTQWWGEQTRDGVDLIFRADARVHDGRFANNGWLHETPDPLTKLTWDNAALIGPDLAERLGVDTEGMITIAAGDHSLNMAVIVVPGMHASAIVLPLGYGRTIRSAMGDKARIATDAGFNTYTLRTSQTMGFACGANATRASGTYQLALTQDHHAVDSTGGKGMAQRVPTIVREMERDEFSKHPEAIKHRAHVPHSLSLFEENNLEEHNYRWGMSVDLNTCIGCSACVVACQAENNIPIVGKEQVRKSREMHWLRIDRYFSFGKDSHGKHDGSKFKSVAMQPVMCVHCENAPCEQVCPVAATVHDSDGLNVMVYNRCIGTRYCSNNCPYKVRRFNYFDYRRRSPHREQPGTLLQVDPEYYTREQAAADPLQQMQLNPDVSVRVRGVMEKCTYCIQRIQQAKIEAKNEFVKQDKNTRPEKTRVQDGRIQTACQQSCPTQAIEFGDLDDKAAKVTAKHKNPRAYMLLQELNTDPRTKYLAKIWNPSEKGSKVDEADFGHGHGHGSSDSHGEGAGH